MNRALLMGFALAASCATPRLDEDRANQSEKVQARCQLVGSLAAHYNPRGGIVDELRTSGPSRVIWLNRGNSSFVRTPDGNVYVCDRIL